MFRKPIAKVAAAASAALLLALAGCSSTPLDENKGGETASGASTEDAAAALAQQKAALEKQSVFFDFDKYNVKSEYVPVVEAHAKFMNANPSVTARIEGNTDARGSREYNLALGQRRSEAVKQRLQLLGVPASRIEAVSFGKEHPRATGTSEADYAQNRRADVAY